MTNNAVHKNLITKLHGKKAVIGVIGLGYVGLPLMIRFCEEGFKVIGIDRNASKVNLLNRGRSYVEYISSGSIMAARKRGFQATTSMARAAQADAIIICVPTPLNKHREPDISFIVNTMDALVPYLCRGQIVSLESTSYPGTTDEELKPRIESRALRIGRDIFLVFSPERVDPMNSKFSIRNIPKVCGGTTPACLKAGVALYAQIIDQIVPVSSTRTAEMTKLLENIHRAVNIRLVNEMKIIADRMNIDIHEVIRAASTKPFGFVPYYPGPGMGGHCIPVDPYYLTWKAHEYGVHTRFIELAGEINDAMPEWIVFKIAELLNSRGKSVRGSRILVLGIAYKKNVDDMRESPAIKIMDLLIQKGARIDYSDPHIPVFTSSGNKHGKLKSIALTAKSIARYDGVALITNHDAFDYTLIKKYAKLIVDSRGVYLAPSSKIVKA